MAKRKMSTFERLRSGSMNRQERKEWQQRLYAEDAGLEAVHPDAAGIDVGSKSHFVAVPADRDSQPVREFGSWTADLKRLSAWLKSRGIRTVAMQATGVYWIALQEVLEAEGIDTIGGFVFNRLGYLPQAGARIELPRFTATVRRTSRKRIKELLLEKTICVDDQTEAA